MRLGRAKRIGAESVVRELPSVGARRWKLVPALFRLTVFLRTDARPISL
jgi:hypothetical protein